MAAVPAPGPPPLPSPLPASASEDLAGFDPVRQRFLQALARRCTTLQGPARSRLEQRLAQAQASHDSALERARGQAAAALAALQARHPAAAPALQACWHRGDFAAMHRLGQTLAGPRPPGALAALLQHIQSQRADDASGSGPVAQVELKTLRQARSSWMRLRVDQQLARSRAKLPDNPGPLNSHRLVLRCLQRLQGLSPAYLAPMLSYLETLAWLEAATPPAAREARPKR